MLVYNVPTSNKHSFQINGGENMYLNNNQLFSNGANMMNLSGNNVSYSTVQETNGLFNIISASDCNFITNIAP